MSELVRASIGAIFHAKSAVHSFSRVDHLLEERKRLHSAGQILAKLNFEGITLDGEYVRVDDLICDAYEAIDGDLLRHLGADSEGHVIMSGVRISYCEDEGFAVETIKERD